MQVKRKITNHKSGSRFFLFGEVDLLKSLLFCTVLDSNMWDETIKKIYINNGGE